MRNSNLGHDMRDFFYEAPHFQDEVHDLFDKG